MSSCKCSISACTARVSWRLSGAFTGTCDMSRGISLREWPIRSWKGEKPVEVLTVFIRLKCTKGSHSCSCCAYTFPSSPWPLVHVHPLCPPSLLPVVLHYL
jgi:hypothetical protein